MTKSSHLVTTKQKAQTEKIGTQPGTFFFFVISLPESIHFSTRISCKKSYLEKQRGALRKAAIEYFSVELLVFRKLFCILIAMTEELI
jgi:hypothetical protein